MLPITALVYAGLAVSAGLFAQDIYATAMQPYGDPKCQNFQYVENTGIHPIDAYPKIMINNAYNLSKRIIYKMKMCTVEKYHCTPLFFRNRTIPANGHFEDEVPLIFDVDFQRPGDYHYTVMIDIEGDINEHTEKTCGIHIRRDN